MEHQQPRQDPSEDELEEEQETKEEETKETEEQEQDQLEEQEQDQLEEQEQHREEHQEEEHTDTKEGQLQDDHEPEAKQQEHKEEDQLEEHKEEETTHEEKGQDELEKDEHKEKDQLEEQDTQEQGHHQEETEEKEQQEEQKEGEPKEELVVKHPPPTKPLLPTKLPTSIPKPPSSIQHRSFRAIQPSNPLSIRSNFASKLPPASKITPPIPRSKVSIAPKPKSLAPPTKPPSRSLAKSVSSSSAAPTKPASKTSTTTPTRSLPSKPSQPCVTHRSKTPVTPSKSSSITPSKPARPSTLTPAKAGYITPSKPTLSRSTSALSVEKNHSLPNSERPKTPKTPKAPRTPKTSKILDSQIDPPTEQNPQPSAKKSSQAFREMLAQAKRNRSQPQNTSTSSDPNLIADPPKDLDPWGLPPIDQVIEKAQRTGKLNASSRMMPKVPNEIYASLLSHTSIFHPSNRPSTNTNSGQPSSPVVDISFSPREDEDSRPVAWYETVPLVHLNLSLNELTELEGEFGGFEALTRCDLHCNQLKGLPCSFGLLVSLTYLDLSANHLVQFPIPIMSLINLQELNLSKNKLTRLWPLEWKPTLKTQLATALQPPGSSIHHDSLEGDQSFNSVDQPSTIITESSFTQEEFCDQFPSSPTKLQSNTHDRAEKKENAPRRKNQEPFPSLKTLKLGSNKLTRSGLLGSDSVQLPTNLIDLDLSKNPLGDGPIDVSANLGNLKKLKKLNLSGCELQDEIFCKGDYDELSEEEEVIFFTELNELDLSHNAIDSLGPFETFFEENCQSSFNQRLDYQGLPLELVKMIQPRGVATESGSELKVMIGNSFLRQEAKRRRKLYAARAVDQPSVAPVVTTESIKLEADKRESEDVTQEEYINEDHDLPTQTIVVTHQAPTKKLNPTEILFIKHFNPASYTINLEGLQLSDLPDDQEICDQMIQDHSVFSSSQVQTINLSKNQLTRIPIELVYSFGDTLTVLNLSRNRLVNLERNIQSGLENLKTLDNFNENIRLNQLIELNLSSNYFTGSLKPIIDLIIKKLKCFNLKILDLRLNRFENLDGLIDLLNLLHLNLYPNIQIHGQAQNGDVDFFKLERILLDGNQINQIDDLVHFATQTHSKFHHLFLSSSSSATTPETLDIKTTELFMDQISLSDNSIQQLPFVLGYLPINKLDLARNLFRFPHRKLYDCPGGNVKILTWLRDRFSSSSSNDV